MGVVYFSIIPTFEPSRYCKCWIVCFYNIISEKGRVLASKSPCYTLEKQYRGNYHERKTEKEEAGL